MNIVFLSQGITGSHASGHPSIWSDGRLNEECCRWLNDDLVPRTRSPHTWAQAARAVTSWLDFCEACEVDWRFATKADLVAYRDAYLSATSPLTQQQYSPNTVRVRMVYIIEFIEYAVNQGWSDGDETSKSNLQDSARNRVSLSLDTDALAHIRKGAGSVPRNNQLTSLLPKSPQDNTVRVLKRAELMALLRCAGPRASARTDGDEGSERDRVILDLGWAAGLRIEEMVGLKIYPIEVLTPDPLYEGELFKLSVRGKGNKIRQIDLPAWLVLDLQAYIRGERRTVLRERGKKISEGALLLNSAESSNRAGRPMKTPGLRALMKRLCEGAGLTKIKERHNPETGEHSVLSVARFSMHSLRHTYAVMTYHNHRSSGINDVEAWKYIQMQLGHVSPQVTISTYLNHVTAWSDLRTSRTLLDLTGL